MEKSGEVGKGRRKMAHLQRSHFVLPLDLCINHQVNIYKCIYHLKVCVCKSIVVRFKVEHTSCL